MKKCEICGKEFTPIKGGGTRKYCFECSPSTKNGEGEKERQVHNKTVLRRAMKKQAVKIKGGKCSKCNYDKCIDALEFHHLDPAIKESGLGNGNTRSWDKYKKELEKCILLCANCHREEHNK
ncbi:MAG: hypothetical protein KQ78_01975 [Candidatus Izimaplasma bacterium HR2]|nr:MAG: hypothetical protein KQ78_01975 [Candidatus Izimaplasma bacterium HR2]